ncbi:MAG: hypothetical protein ABI609_08400 [Acidobacteriota bacterium]
MSAPTTRGILAIGIALLLPGLAVGQPAPRTPVATTPHFAFYSDFETNLNDALVNMGLARKGAKPELFHAGAEATCFEALAPSVRAGWNGAVDYYAQIISPAGWNARQQYLLRMQLVGFEAEAKAMDGAEFVELARNFRAVAAPAYRACRWTAQDEQNRSWLAEIQPKLAASEAKLTHRLEQLYQATWKKLPVLVDLVETVDWSGANTSWSDAGQGDVLISSTVGGAPGFETLLHESSHVLMDRSNPVPVALAKAAKAADFKLPGDLWHVVLFYTTGEAVRPILDEGAATPYSPMLYEIFKRGSWAEYREALEKEWLPYVQGKRSLDEAATALVAAVKAQKAK